MSFVAPDAKSIEMIRANSNGNRFFNKILVPLDFSECSMNALSQALVLASAGTTEVVLAHAVHIPMKTATADTHPFEALEEEARLALSAVAAELRAWVSANGFSKLTITEKVSVGFPAEEIVRLSKSEKADLIVMGTQGAGGVGGYLLGSNATTVIGKADGPVLAMPPGRTLDNLSKVAFATDLQVIDMASIEATITIAEPFGATLEFLHLFTPGELLANDQMTAFEKKVREVSPYKKLNFEAYETFHDDIQEALEQYLQDNKVNIMAMLRRERGFWERIFHRSVTKQMAISAHTPLLILHE